MVPNLGLDPQFLFLYPPDTVEAQAPVLEPEIRLHLPPDIVEL
jgi:hypothetical protein